MLPSRSEILAEAISNAFRYIGYVLLKNMHRSIFVNSSNKMLTLPPLPSTVYAVSTGLDVSSFDCHPTFPHLNLPTTIAKKIISNFNGLPHFTPPTETSPEETQTQSFVTNFLSYTPRQYESNHRKQDLLITTNKISHSLLQLQIIKVIKFHLRSTC